MMRVYQAQHACLAASSHVAARREGSGSEEGQDPRDTWNDVYALSDNSSV